MKLAHVIVSVALGSLVMSGEASAKGCLKGAAVGGVAGHFAGGHSVIGAGVGCVIGRHRANKADRQAAAAASSKPLPPRSK